MAKKKLGYRERRFVEEYLVDLNATKAAIRAGYSEHSAATIAHENMQKPHIAEALEREMDARSRRTLVRADKVVQELEYLATARMSRIVKWGTGGITLTPQDELSERELAAIAEVSETRNRRGGVTVKVRLHSKTAAADLLCKHLGLYQKGEDADKIPEGGKTLTLKYSLSKERKE